MMKIYDKDMYQKEQKMQSIIMIVIIFVIGFVIGYFAHNFEKQEEINTLEKEMYVLQKQLNTI